MFLALPMYLPNDYVTTVHNTPFSSLSHYVHTYTRLWITEDPIDDFGRSRDETRPGESERARERDPPPLKALTIAVN